MLELECSKLGVQVEKEKADNQRLRFEVGELRKNIDFLNRKLENVHKDHEYLTKNNDYGQMEKQQLKDQLQKIKLASKHKEEEAQYQRSIIQSKINNLEQTVQQLTIQNNALTQDIKCLREENDEISEELGEMTKQYEYIKGSFEERKKEWDRTRQELENNTRDNLDKKGEKITKYQVQIQSLTDKLKEE